MMDPASTSSLMECFIHSTCIELFEMCVCVCVCVRVCACVRARARSLACLAFFTRTEVCIEEPESTLVFIGVIARHLS
jgi:hypothetical protein